MIASTDGGRLSAKGVEERRPARARVPCSRGGFWCPNDRPRSAVGHEPPLVRLIELGLLAESPGLETDDDTIEEQLGESAAFRGGAALSSRGTAT